MWHDAAFRGPSRDQRAARPAGTAGQADDDLAGRDPQLLRPRVPGEAGRAAGPLHHDVVRADAESAATTCSAPSIAARTTRRWGAGSTSWSRPSFEQLALAGGTGPVDGRAGRAAVRPVPLRRLPPGQPDRPCSAAGGGLRAAGPDPAGQATSGSHGRRARTSATRSCGPSRRSWPATSR